jgi:hypothetical protein
MHPKSRNLLLAILSLGVVIGAGLPFGVDALSPGAPAAPAAPSAPPTPPPPVVLNATVGLGQLVGHHLASPFFAAVFTATSPSTAVMQAMGAYFNTTPITLFRFGGDGEGYDPTTQTFYAPPTGSGRYVASHVQLWNLSWFKSWCDARTPRCAWLGYLPGELNNTTAAVHVAEWFHSTLGLVPTAWQLSNEPELWTHYGENYTQWSTTDSAAPTGLDYATMVQSYIRAVRALYPQDQFIGIEAACATCDRPRVSDTAALNGPSLAALAYHSYPTANASSTSVAALYGTLVGPGSIPVTVAGFRGLYAAACPTCGDLPTQIGEYQAGPPSAFSPLATGYPGAVFLSASVIEALESNVSTFTVFNDFSLYNASLHRPTVEGLLYQRLLDNLTMGDDYTLDFGAGGLVGVFGVLVHNGTRESMLIVNANLTAELNLTVPLVGFPANEPGSEWTWGPTASVPTAEVGIALPQTYTVPPQGILLVNNF